MKKITYKGLLAASLFSVLFFFYSCDLNSPIDLELILVSNESLDFGLFTDYLEFTVENTDTTTAAWDIYTSQNWISVEPSTGNLRPGGIDTFRVSISRDGLAAGDYAGDISIEIQGAAESIIVTARMLIKPISVLANRQINFSSSETEGSFTIENRGNYPMRWTTVSDQEWLTVSPDSGTTNPSRIPQSMKQEKEKKIKDVSTISFSVNRGLLTAGVHVGLIEVQSNAGNDSVYVTVPQDDGPILSVSTTRLNFDSNTLSRTITIDNIGGGILDWQAESADDWVTITPAQGSISSQALFATLSKYNILSKTMSINEMEVEISVDIANLPPGETSSTVDITSNGGNATIELTVTAPEEPVISISETLLDFGTTGTTLTFDIANTGGGRLEWNAVASSNSLAITPATGSTSSSQTVAVALDRSLLTGTGVKTFTIDITSNGGNGQIAVTATVPENPTLVVVPLSLDFGVNLSARTFAISNSGTGTLTWAITKVGTFFSLTPANGSSNAGTASNQINVTVNRTNLAPGIYTGYAIVTSNGGVDTVEIRMSVSLNAALAVSSNVVDFGVESNQEQILIINTGNGEINWNTSIEYQNKSDIEKIDTETEGWLSVDPVSGTTTGQTTLFFNAHRESVFDYGESEAVVHITSDAGDVDVTVKIISEAPVIEVLPTNLDFGTTTPMLEFAVKNVGAGELNWNSQIEYLMDDIPAWLTLSLDYDNTTTKSDVQAAVDRSSLSSGIYEAIIHIYSNGGDVDINVIMEVAGSNINVSTNSLDFGASKTEMTFNVTNSGAGTLNYNMASASQWISISPAGGSVASGSDVITVTVNRFPSLSNLNYKSRFTKTDSEFRGTIEIQNIDDELDQEIVEVIMRIEPPKIGLDPVLLDFGETETEMTFDIKNTGSGTLNYSFSTQDDWISLSKYSGSVGADKEVITVTVTRNNPESVKSSYKNRSAKSTEVTGHIIVFNTNDQYDTRTIEVRMTLLDPPVFSISTTTLDFGTSDNTLPLEINNLGEAPLEWWVNIYDPGVGVDRANETITTGTSTTNVTVDRTMQPGFHSVIMYFGSNGGSEEVTVTWTIPES